VTVRVPPQVQPGGYWAALTVDELPDPLTNPPGVGMRLYTSISVGIYVYIDPVERKARITEIRVLPDHAELKIPTRATAPWQWRDASSSSSPARRIRPIPS